MMAWQAHAFGVGMLSGALLALVAAGSSPAQAARRVEGDRVTISWAPASGPVAHYGVYVSRDGAPFPDAPDHVTSATEATLSGDPQSVVSVRVRAFDAAGNAGPFSTVSDEIVFLEPSTAPAARPDPVSRERGSFDFDGDGHDDLVLRDPASGAVTVWLMGPDGPWHAEGVGALAGDVELVAASDLDGDGRSDLLWRERGTGALHAWRMVGAARAALLPVPSAPVVLAADLDEGGRADLVVRRGAGLEVLGGEGSTWELAAPAADLELACAGDFDGDGDLDLLWHGGAALPARIWNLERGRFAWERTLDTVAPPGWRALSCADGDGDGDDDVLWHEPVAGTSLLWTLVSGAVGDVVPVRAAGKGSRVGAVGDYDGDGRSNELVLQDAAGPQLVRAVSWSDGAAEDPGHVLAGAGGARVVAPD